MPHPVTPLLCAALLWGSTARAQGYDDPFGWLTPPAETQLAEDDTVIPLGKGAIFVPAITNPLDEPPVILVGTDGEDVVDITTGKRTLVEPGRYTVIVSSGSPAQGVGQAIDVVEGETTLVPVTWAALQIEVVDARRVPHRGGYELIRADTREPYGTGFGADTLQGETAPTWMLPPGVYRIVKVGGNYRALRDFATVYVPEGGLVRYRLVTDPDTGDFLGSGMVLPGEFGSTRTGRGSFFTSLVLGADGSLVQLNNVAGANNQLLVSGDVFLDGQIGYRRAEHTATALLQIEEGASQIRPQAGDPLPFIKSRDRLRGDLLYTWYARPSIGPYARVAAETHAFATDTLAFAETRLVLEDSSGGVSTVDLLPNETFRIAAPWQPTLVREGAGLNTRLVNSRWVTFNFRLGLGLRQNQFGGAWTINDAPNTNDIEYLQVESFQQEGVESTIIATARLPGWVVYATDVELFSDFTTFTEPSIEWRNTLSLRLTRNLSLNYYADVGHLPQVVDVTQFEQSVLLRASWQLL